MEDWNEVFGYSTVTPQIEHSPKSMQQFLHHEGTSQMAQGTHAQT